MMLFEVVVKWSYGAPPPGAIEYSIKMEGHPQLNWKVTPVEHKECQDNNISIFKFEPDDKSADKYLGGFPLILVYAHTAGGLISGRGWITELFCARDE